MIYAFGECVLDTQRHVLWRQGHPVHLRPKAFAVLVYLVEHRDQVVTKQALCEHVWHNQFISDATLGSTIRAVRQAIGDTGEAQQLVQTVHGSGYRCVAPVTVCAAHPVVPGPATATVTPLPVPEAPRPAAPPPSAFHPAPSVHLSVAAAECRQLTVLWCAVVDFLTVAGALDPEDCHDLMVQYHATCTAVIQRYGGHIVQYLWEGLLVYFGYPTAQEDAPRRAVHTGMALVTAVRDLGNTLVHEYGVRLAVRIGIHTGPVVMGARDGDATYSQLAVGVTPALAATLQGLAAPETVVISDATAGLVQGYFVCQRLGEHQLPGLTAPRTLYQVLGASGAHGRLDLTPLQQRTPFVGREAELGMLWERAAQVRQGLGQGVLLRGETGIGKSRLVQEVQATLTAAGFTSIALWGSPYAQHTTLHPVIEWLQGSGQDAAETPGSARLARLEDCVQQARLDLREHLPLLAALLHLVLPQEQYPPLQLIPQLQRQRTLDTLVALLLGLAARQPVLVIVEDLHWIDPTTLDWLRLVIDQGPTAPLFTLLTCRPTFASPWGERTHVVALSVPRLAPQHVSQMVQWLGGDRLSAAERQHIMTQTDGVPLFVEEVTRFVLAAHRPHGLPGRPVSDHVAPEVSIPTTLRDALMARLDQLGSAKGTAQLGATMGREFPAALLQAVTPLDEERLRQELQQLVEAELLYQRGVGATAVYQFKHALIQEAAYASLRRQTRQQYHQRIAQVVEGRFPELVEAQPELVAHHYTAAGLQAQALPYWQRAGQRMLAQSAYVEAISHLTTGLELLHALPDTPARTQQEIDLQMTLGPALMALKGWSAPEVEHAYARAQALCQQVGHTPQHFHVLAGLVAFHVVRGELQTAQRLAEQGTTVAQSLQDPACLLLARTMLGMSLFYRGALLPSRTPWRRRSPATIPVSTTA